MSALDGVPERDTPEEQAIAIIEQLSSGVADGEISPAAYARIVVALGVELGDVAEKQGAESEGGASSAAKLLNRAVELARQAGVSPEEEMVVAASELSRVTGRTNESLTESLDLPAPQDLDLP